MTVYEYDNLLRIRLTYSFPNFITTMYLISIIYVIIMYACTYYVYKSNLISLNIFIKRLLLNKFNRRTLICNKNILSL